MILGLIGDIASILGLSLVVIEQIRKKFVGEAGVILGYLKALSVKSKGWKELHHKYHSLSPFIKEITFQITNDRGESIKPSDIAPNALRHAFVSGPFRACLETFESTSEDFISSIAVDIQRSGEAQFTQDLEKVKNKNVRLGETLAEIVRCRKTIYESHKTFCSFVREIRGFLDDETRDWTEKEVRFVLQHRKFLMVNYWNIALNVDIILMAFLDLYNSITDEIK